MTTILYGVTRCYHTDELDDETFCRVYRTAEIAMAEAQANLKECVEEEEFGDEGDAAETLVWREVPGNIDGNNAPSFVADVEEYEPGEYVVFPMVLED